MNVEIIILCHILIVHLKFRNLHASKYGQPNSADGSHHPIHLMSMGINNDDENSNSQMLYEDGEDDAESGKLISSINKNILYFICVLFNIIKLSIYFRYMNETMYVCC